MKMKTYHSTTRGGILRLSGHWPFCENKVEDLKEALHNNSVTMSILRMPSSFKLGFKSNPFQFSQITL
jgi:hypothetical protein